MEWMGKGIGDFPLPQKTGNVTLNAWKTQKNDQEVFLLLKLIHARKTPNQITFVLPIKSVC